MQENQILNHFKCAKCKEYPMIPYETLCCGAVFCELCINTLTFLCSECNKSLSKMPSKFISNLFSKIQSTCHYCGTLLFINELNSHSKSCLDFPFPCKICQATVSQRNLIVHLSIFHQNFITDSIFSVQSSGLLEAKKNRFGRIASLSKNGKFYCGGPLDIQCSCCDHRCGPTDGCNCTGCLKLDCKTRNLNNNFFVNREGAICKLTNIGVYCGRRILEGVFDCDGYCGPTNGPNCHACKVFQKRITQYIEKLKISE